MAVIELPVGAGLLRDRDLFKFAVHTIFRQLREATVKFRFLTAVLPPSAFAAIITGCLMFHSAPLLTTAAVVLAIPAGMVLLETYVLVRAAHAPERARMLLLHRSAVGIALHTATVRTEREAGRAYPQGTPYWQLKDLASLPARSSGRAQIDDDRPDRRRRAGRLLVQDTIALAQQRQVGLCLTATSRRLAESLYVHAGFVYDDPNNRRSWTVPMHLPDPGRKGAAP